MGNDKQDIKQPYEKPRLRTIELAAEEVLAAGCKTMGAQAGPVPPSCVISNCAGQGS